MPPGPHVPAVMEEQGVCLRGAAGAQRIRRSRGSGDVLLAQSTAAIPAPCILPTGQQGKGKGAGLWYCGKTCGLVLWGEEQGC